MFIKRVLAYINGDSNANTIDDAIDRPVICTSTKEPLMPVRLTYKIHNEYLLIKALKKLKCIGFDDNKYFILSYFKEAKNLDLAVHYQDVPEELYPIILAEGYIKKGAILHLDLKSLQRAVLIIDFLAKYIPPTIAEITRFANSNKLLTTSTNEQDVKDIMELNYDQFFAEDQVYHAKYDLDLDDADIDDIEVDDNVVSMNDDKMLDNLEQICVSTNLDRLESQIREQELKDYHDVEVININYNKRKHTELIKLLTFKAITKSMIAVKRHKGDNNYSSIDAIKELMHASLSKDDNE